MTQTDALDDKGMKEDELESTELPDNQRWTSGQGPAGRLSHRDMDKRSNAAQKLLNARLHAVFASLTSCVEFAPVRKYGPQAALRGRPETPSWGQLFQSQSLIS